MRRIYGSDHFDVEVWNELGFGSDFLNQSAYYSPPPDAATVTRNLNGVEKALLGQTIQMLRNPANGLTDVRVGDGFRDQIPWISGTLVPRGTNGIDRHPYQQVWHVQDLRSRPGSSRSTLSADLTTGQSGREARRNISTPSLRTTAYSCPSSG